MSDEWRGDARPDDDFARQVRPALPRRRMPPPREAKPGSLTDELSSTDAVARVRGEVAELSKLVARVADAVALLDDKMTTLAGLVRGQRDQASDLAFHLESLATAIRVDHASVETQMGTVLQTVRRLEEGLVPTIETKVDGAVSDLLAALDHELTEQYERSVKQSQEVSDGLAELKAKGPADAAVMRKAVGDLGRGLRKQVGDELAHFDERQQAMEESIRELLAEVAALRRRIPLRAGDQDLSPEERERLAVSIARLVAADGPAGSRPRKAQGSRQPRGG